eukprot:SAG31_NODE_3123_length_4651_cov_2.784490_2_plen_180_part_00
MPVPLTELPTASLACIVRNLTIFATCCRHIDLEAPAEVNKPTATQLLVLFHGPLPSDSNSASNFEFRIPLHFRYQPPSNRSCDGIGPYTVVKIPPPRVELYCGARERNKESWLSASVAPVAKSSHEGVDSTGGMAGLDAPLEALVPTGQLDHRFIVWIGTVAVTLLGASATAVAACSKQ